MKKKIGVGLIGYKFMGKAHSNAWRKAGMFFDAPADVHMQAICGRDEDWLKQSAQKYGWNGYETSWQKLIGREDIHAIDITAPSDMHMEIAVAAAEAGKHVICEKPMALNVADARKMLAAADKSGVKHQIGFNYRFAPAVLLAKELIDKGKIGKVFHFRGQYLQDFIIDPLFPRIWRLDKSVAGSGSHGDLSAHVIDLARFLVGEFKTVTGMSKTFIKERPLVERMEGLSATAGTDVEMAPVTVDDATLFLTEFECGALGVFEATRFAAGHKNALRFEINGSLGSIIFELERLNELQFFSREDDANAQGFRSIMVTEATHPYISAWWPPGHIIGYEHTFVHEILSFITSIANDSRALPDFNDGVKCSQILEAVDVSIENGGWVNVGDI
ncbi:MAG: Gfo/Idh/MocA family oxidoreductase [Defluviitaleaceae bacterium]|nr:Gfo/Idh/MocA family oxidoreductase [Defluviitaleaceae bacterium]